jgi:hypothetical protein
MALKSLKNNKQIRILQADKGNSTVVLNKSTYKEKISSLLESWVFEILCKDPMSQIERKIRLPKIHKPNIPLRPIVSSIESPCYALAEFLHKILSPLAGNTSSFMKNSEKFIKSIQDINFQNGDYLTRFDVVSLFSNVPVEEVLQVIRSGLSADPSLPECSPLQVEDEMETTGHLFKNDVLPV